MAAISDLIKETSALSRTNYTVSGNVVPRIQQYDYNERLTPMMHRAFKNLEEGHVNALVDIASECRGVGAGGLKVLDIGFGLGYSAKAFLNAGVTDYTCVEINYSLSSQANSWLNYWCGMDFGQTVDEYPYCVIPIGASIVNQSWNQYADENPAKENNGFDFVLITKLFSFAISFIFF